MKRADFKPKGMNQNLYDRDVQLFVRNLIKNVKEKFKDTLAGILIVFFKYTHTHTYINKKGGCVVLMRYRV